MIKLKPCPFCGSTSVEYFEERIFIMNNASLIGVKCNNCGAAVMTADKERCPNDVFEMWNRRSSTNIILCTDCRYFDSYPVDHTDGKCTRFHGLVCYDDFCSDAEEKEETE